MPEYAWQIGYGLLGGLAGYLVLHGILALRIVRLQFAVVGLQQQLLSVRNTNRVNKRWNERDELEQSMAELAVTAKRRPARFDNDPIVYEPGDR